MLSPLKRLIKAIAPALAPWIARKKQENILVAPAKQIRLSCDRCANLEAQIDLVLTPGLFKANQKKIEIQQLLNLIEKLRPRYLCEIGSDKGGTLLLFSRIATTNAKLISIDLNYPAALAKAVPKLIRRGQNATCIAADSHDLDTLRTVREQLHGSQLDFLFIDGDHSLEGVSKDFEMYAPLVRKGGIIAFHDIVPDFKTRFGILTEADVGEVPAFWASLKRDHASNKEFIENPDQDGYGIGVLIVDEGLIA